MNRFVPIAGWLALFFGFSALFFFIVAPNLTPLILSLAGLGLANGLFFIFEERKAIQTGIKTRAAIYGINTLVLTAVFLGILVFINLLSHRHKHRFDFTEGGYFTLAPQTQKIVSNLPREVKITAFYQTEAANKTDFQNLIDGYQELTDKIKVNYVDPDKSPAITKQYGVTTYGTIALESGSQETKLKEPTEESLTNALLKVIQDKKKTIYFLEGHGESAIDSTDPAGYSSARKALEKDGFRVEKLLLLQTGKIPDDTDLLVLSGPKKPVVSQEQKLIEDYLNAGGSALILVDPQSSFGMEEFLLKWGIEVGNNIVIDPLSRLFGGDLSAPVISQYTLHDITREFTLPTIFPVLRSVSAKQTPGIEVTELLQTGPNSWGETNLGFKDTRLKVNFDEGVDKKGPVSAVVLATRTIGPEEKDQNENQEDGGKTTPAEPSNRKAKIVVVGDSDFATNNYFNFSGNGDFFLNTASWLAEEKNLISIRPKERKNQPLHLTRTSGNSVFILGTIVFPALVIIAGLKNWWRRRRL